MARGTGGAHFSGLEVSLEHTMPELVEHVALRHADKPFLSAEDSSRTTFAQFRDRVHALARGLIAAGVDQGDRVAIWAPNSPEWIVVAAAIQSIGAIMVPINTRFKGLEAGYALAKTRARMLFTVGSFLGNDYVAMLQRACGGVGRGCPVADLEHLERIVLVDGPELDAFAAQPCGAATLRRRLEAVTPQTIADILFTSGTTGAPKGAMHSHGQSLWMVGLWNAANDLRAGDRMAIVNPFFHSFGYRSGWLSALAAGITAYPVAKFDAAAMLELIERERITVLMGPPTIFQALLDHPRLADCDIGSLRVGHTGAAGVPVELIRAARDVLGFDLFLTSFGQTESTALISVNAAGASFETIAGTVGRPLPGVEVKIVDAAGDDQPQGENGELLVRGPNVMQGYFEDPEQTAATIDHEGWLHTGDVASVGDDGTLRIHDRLKDVVIVGGFNAYPAEIETILRAHPAIAEVSVIALPDERLGEVCGACVILRDGARLTLAELGKWSRERMANYKAPRGLFVVQEFPRTALGKVQKYALREMALREHA